MPFVVIIPAKGPPAQLLKPTEGVGLLQTYRMVTNLHALKPSQPTDCKMKIVTGLCNQRWVFHQHPKNTEPLNSLALKETHCWILRVPAVWLKSLATLAQLSSNVVKAQVSRHLICFELQPLRPHCFLFGLLQRCPMTVTARFKLKTAMGGSSAEVGEEQSNIVKHEIEY